MFTKIKSEKFREFVGGDNVKKGQEDFKNGAIAGVGGVKTFWVKKEIPADKWNSDYSKQEGAYCPLFQAGEKGNQRMVAGFCVGNRIPSDCQEITDGEELRRLDLYRRSMSFMPYPLEEVIKVEEEAYPDYV